MKRFSYCVLLVMMLVSACSSATPEPTATAVPPTVTNTIAPTDTPLPTATPTLVPTATPDVAATVAAQATESAGSVLAELDELLGESDVPYKDGHLTWLQPDDVSVKMSGPATLIQEIDDTPKAGNFILKSDVTWNTSGLILCGVVFRSEANVMKGKQYQFLYLRLSGLPAWAIEVHEFGRFQNSPTAVKFSDALDLANGATNTLVLVAQDEAFTLYINDKRQGRYFDYSKQRSEGAFAFLGSQDSGEGNCKFENSWIWSLE